MCVWCQIYAGTTCGGAPLRSYAASAIEQCEDLDIVSFQITDCEETALVVDFYSDGMCDASNDVESLKLPMDICVAIPHVNEFSNKVIISALRGARLLHLLLHVVVQVYC